MTQLQSAINNQRIPSWSAVVAVLHAMDGLEQMDKLRTLGAALAVVLAEPSLRSLDKETP